MTKQSKPLTDFLMSRPEVEAMTAKSRAGIYELIAERQFPRPLRTGRRSVAWRHSEIMGWIESRKRA